MILGVVAALRGEARALYPALRIGRGEGEDRRILLQVSGVGAAAAARAAEELVRAGAGALMSWGVAGALDPSLPTGALCLPCAVLEASPVSDPVPMSTTLPVPPAVAAALPTSTQWRSAIAAAARRAGLPLSEGVLLSGLGEALATVAAKHAAHAASGAVAVDMESAAVARVARRAALPFIVVRTVLDAAGDAIPGSIVRASRAGPVNLALLAAGVLAAPGELPALWRLAGRYRTARHRLRMLARFGSLWPALSEIRPT